MADYSEEEIIVDFQAGAEKAFNWVYKEYYKKIFNFCFGITGNTQESQDITIILLHRLFKKHKDFTTLPDIRSYLYVAARNQSLNYSRNLKTRAQKHKELLTEAKEQIFIVNDWPDYADLIKKHVEELPIRSGQVIDMIYFQDMSYKQIAEKMQISETTVGSHREKALNNLRKNFPEKRIFIQAGILSFLFLIWF